MTITADQIRAARALKNWSQSDLASRVEMATPSIGNIEAGKHAPTRQTQEAIREVFEDAGVEFIEGGVRKKQDLIQIFEGNDCYLRLLDDVFLKLEPIGGEVLFSSSDERRSSISVIEKLKSIRRSGIKMRTLVRMNDSHLMGSLEEYRWMPEETYVESDVKVIYDNTTAYAVTWKDNPKVIIIRDEMIANEARRMFEFLWKQGKQPTHSTAEIFY